MILARIVGTVVATRKDDRLHGRKLLVARLVGVDGQDEKGHLVAVDTVGAGIHEVVLIVQGSSARMAFGCKECPIDAAVVGIVETVEVRSPWKTQEDQANRTGSDQFACQRLLR